MHICVMQFQGVKEYGCLELTFHMCCDTINDCVTDMKNVDTFWVDNFISSLQIRTREELKFVIKVAKL